MDEDYGQFAKFLTQHRETSNTELGQTQPEVVPDEDNGKPAAMSADMSRRLISLFCHRHSGRELGVSQAASLGNPRLTGDGEVEGEELVAEDQTHGVISR